jgi:hypothetical protein
MGKVTDAIALLAKRAAAGDEAAADVVAGFTDYAFKVDGVPVSGQQWAYRIGVSDDQGDLIKKAVYDARGDMVKAIENLDRMENAGMVREPGLSRRFAEGVTSGKYSDLLTNRVTSIGKNAVVAGAAAIAAGTMTPQEAQASTPQDQQASEYPSLGGMGVRMPPTAEDEEAMLAPTGGDLMQQANRDFVSSIRTQPEPDFLTGVQQQLLSGIMKTAGVADLSADVVSAMAGPLLSAPGAIARYAADRYVPGVNYSAEEMAQGRRETEDYFNYQPRTEQGPQYGEQIMQGIGGAIAPYVPAIKKAAGDSYILGAMRQGYDYLGDKEKVFFEALGDIFSPI